MERIDRQTFETHITHIPLSFFWISVSIIVGSLATFFAISLYIGYSDHYSQHANIQRKNADTIFITGMPVDMRNNLARHQPVTIQYPFASTMVTEHGTVVGYYSIDTTIAIKERPDSKLPTNMLGINHIYCIVAFDGPRKSILTRILSNIKIAPTN